MDKDFIICDIKMQRELSQILIFCKNLTKYYWVMLQFYIIDFGKRKKNG